MKIKDIPLMNRIREQANGRCEGCGYVCRYELNIHHIMGRGAGRVDIPENLIALGDVWDCNCHGRFHHGSGIKLQLMASCYLAIVATRENTTPRAIIDKVWLIRRTHKYAELINDG